MAGGFFLKNKSGTAGKKRKLTKKLGKKPVKNDKNTKDISEIEEDEDDDSELSAGSGLESGSDAEEEEETVQEKKLRLAKEYIKQLEKSEEEKENANAIDNDAIAHRLEQDALEDAGRLHKFVASRLLEPDATTFRVLKGHRLPLTAVVISDDGKFIFSASKCGLIIKWDLTSGSKLGSIQRKASKNSTEETKIGHSGQVLALALSTDFKYLASAGQDRVIHIWDPDTLEHIHTFKGHRSQITALSFRKREHQLFSGSHDKTVKVWNLKEMAYVETLFGHEDAVMSTSSLLRDRLVTCGARDRSVRLWKIPEESQLVFQTNIGSSIECSSMLNEEYFISGGDDGSLSIWFVRKKRPVTLRTNAHTREGQRETWVTSVEALPFTDIVASGSNDGYIKLWKCEKSFRSLMPLYTIPVNGFVNCLRFSSSGDHLICAMGQEHRLGRWERIKEAKNSILVIPLTYKDADDT